jgi:hypothetical protein
MKRNIYSLRILGESKKLSSIYEGLKGINPVTKEEELICVSKFINKTLRRDSVLKKECFYNIECNKKSSDKYLDYVFGSNLLMPIKFIKKLSFSFKNFEFVLESKSSSSSNERIRILNGRIIAGSVEGVFNIPTPSISFIRI